MPGTTDREFNVYGLGNALLDLQVHAAEADLEALGIEKGGMTLVDTGQRQQILDHFGEATLHRASGGSVANTVITVSQLGGFAAFSGLLGDDAHGRHYREEMEAVGIEVRTATVPRGATGTSVILITPDAERTMTTTLGVSADFGPANVSEDVMRRSEWLYIEGYLFSTDSGRAAVRRAIELAKAHDVKVALTFSDAFVVREFGQALKEAVADAELVFANHVEAKEYTGKEDEDEVFRELRRVAPNVIVTLHERGARASFGDTEYFFEPFKVQPVDVTGAGDTFAGGLLYGITNDHTVAETGRLASFLASRVVAQLGPRLQADVRELVKELQSTSPPPPQP